MVMTKRSVIQNFLLFWKCGQKLYHSELLPDQESHAVLFSLHFLKTILKIPMKVYLLQHITECPDHPLDLSKYPQFVRKQKQFRTIQSQKPKEVVVITRLLACSFSLSNYLPENKSSIIKSMLNTFSTAISNKVAATGQVVGKDKCELLTHFQC